MFLSFGLKDFVDIVSVAIILYYCYKVMKRSRSVNIFYGVLIFISFWIVVSKILEMKVLGGVLDQLVNVGAIALIVLFQEEIRHFFYELGAHEKANRLVRFFRSEKAKSANDEYRYDREVIFPIVMACINMSKQKVGALIVIENDIPLTDFIRTGETIDARISQRLVENIFFKNSPLHDGAMIVAGGKIVAAACILPISHDLDSPKEFGLRHRAGKGVTTDTDALAVIVSEETGNITAAYGDAFRSHLSPEELENILMKGRF